MRSVQNAFAVGVYPSSWKRASTASRDSAHEPVDLHVDALAWKVHTVLVVLLPFILVTHATRVTAVIVLAKTV